MKTLIPSQNSDISEKMPRISLKGDKYLFPGLKIGVVIPAYNEELNIGHLLKRIPNNISDKMEIIVVDDGSADNTYEVANQFGVNVIRHPKNRGNGAATKTGLNFCKKNNFNIVVIIDGDGQHDPKYLSDFVRIINEDSIDFVIGNRFRQYYDMNAYRKFCSKLMTAFYFLLLRKKISDPTNGYRALSSKIIKNVEFESEYSLTQEMLFKVIPKYKFKEFPIKIEQREHGESFIKLKNYLTKIILLFIKYYIFPKITWITHRLLSKETRNRLESLLKT